MGHQLLGHNLWLNYRIHVGSNKDYSTIYGCITNIILAVSSSKDSSEGVSNKIE